MTAPDQHIREQALDVTQSFIVQAPAGSGKTELLIQRYLALLAIVDEPEEALAITFTRKAVAEMRKRVIEALHAAKQPRPESDHAALTWQLANKALQRADDKQWNLLGQPARLRIMTIDSLNASLVRSMPWLSGIGADVAMEQNAQALYEEAAWLTLDSRNADEATQQALQTLLLHLDNNDRRVMRLLCDLLAKRDQWLRYLVPLKSRQDNSDTRQQLTLMFEEVIEEQLVELNASIPFDLGQEMVRIAAAGANQLWSDGNTDKAHMACRELTELPPPSFENVVQWKGLASLYLTGKGGWRSAKSFNKTLGYPVGHDNKEAIQILQGQLQVKDKIHIYFKQIQSLPEIIYQDSQWQMLAALIELLPVAVARLKLVFQQHAAMDFVEQSLAARQALGGDDQVTDLAMKLDYQLKHILMDEFQDTSHSQFTMLEKLLDGWQPDDGRSLFLVGDPMQSIYGFREADVSGFLKVRDNGIGPISPQPLTLQANFRSTPRLMDWFNTVFPDVLASEDNPALGAVSYTEAVSAKPEQANSKVTIHAGLDRDSDAEAQQIMQQVEHSLEQDPEQSIGVLVRSRSHLHELYHYLEASDIEFQALDILPLASQAVIQDLLSVTRTLLHLHDRIAWLAVLRAPWCGLTLASLHTVAAGHPHEDLWSLMNNTVLQQRLDKDERARLENLIKHYQQVLDQADQLTLRTRVQWLWQALGAQACHAEAIADTKTYLDLIDELEQGGNVVTLNAISDALHDVYSSNSSSNQTGSKVQLMTIHKSKGLQFDSVILPALDRGTRSNEKPLLVWHEELGADYESRLLLAPIHAPGGNDQSFDFVRQREQSRKAFETQRLLYVAITRAKSHLHLFASLKSDKEGEPRNPAKGSFLDLIYPHVSNDFDLTSDKSTNNDLDLTNDSVCLHRLPIDWQPTTTGTNIEWQTTEQQTAERERIEFSWAGQAARLVGTLTHQYLHQVSEQGIDQWDEQRLQTLKPTIEASLISSGLPQDALETSTQKVIYALTNIIQSEKAQWILTNHSQAQSEYAISGVINGKIVNRIIDRTFVDEDGTRWIIDYKTSSHEGGNLEGFLDEEQSRYEAQMNEYAQMLGNLGDEPQSIRVGLYFPLMDAWRELYVMGAVCLM
jgi:ATP-dependent exoDNAse (exonuclease V) beta subunit